MRRLIQIVRVITATFAAVVVLVIVFALVAGGSVLALVWMLAEDIYRVFAGGRHG